jgi:hypothetical protein
MLFKMKKMYWYTCDYGSNLLLYLANFETSLDEVATTLGIRECTLDQRRVIECSRESSTALIPMPWLMQSTIPVASNNVEMMTPSHRKYNSMLINAMEVVDSNIRRRKFDFESSMQNAAS